MGRTGRRGPRRLGDAGSRHRRLLAAAGLALTAPSGPAVAQPLPAPLVLLRDVDPSIVQDIRYAGPDNFTGRPLAGYIGSECVLLAGVARALSAVQRDLAGRGLSLKVYDCYRPVRAVRAMVAWVRGAEGDAARRFHPRVPRSKLIAQGYIATQSEHSRGRAVDLTLLRLPVASAPPLDPDRTYGDCTSPAAGRAPDNGIDMGTGFDCFDPRSHASARGLTPEQGEARRTLAEAMRRRGFSGYSREWWHFSMASSEAGGRSFDVPVPARTR